MTDFNTPTIETRLVLYVNGHPTGARLGRTEPLPDLGPFCDTEDGRKRAQAAKLKLSDYLTRNQHDKGK